jgi:hypothetical protein
VARPVYSRNFFNGQLLVPFLALPFPADGFLMVIRDIHVFTISDDFEDRMVIQYDGGAPASTIFASGSVGALGDFGQGGWQHNEMRAVCPKPCNINLIALQGTWTVNINGYDLTLP